MFTDVVKKNFRGLISHDRSKPHSCLRESGSRDGAPTDAFIVYALETLIVGMSHIVKMAVITVVRKKDIWYNEGSSFVSQRHFLYAVFTLHFGMFAAVQTLLYSRNRQILIAREWLALFLFSLVHLHQ